ncbi:mercury resistance system transport protein MerF [Hyphomonas sp.]|uniref:mercury resistance system transport protein MerF n=1 Tax=Hyphomonas sp. TaxID=87 RepID=UPI003567D77F
MNERTLLGAGLAGTVIAALCCFTPVLIVLAGVVGLSAIVGYLDYVLLPALVFFIGLTAYSVWRRNRGARTTDRVIKQD